MTASSPLSLLVLALVAIAVLVVLVTWRKLNAFLALFVAALMVGIGAGMDPLAALKAFQDIVVFCRKYVATKPELVDAGIVKMQPV